MQVKFRSAEEIESEAQHLLDRYAQSKQWVPAPPVPIEKLINFLDLRQEVLDLHSHLGIADTGDLELLGAVSFKTRTIRVDSRIDPVDYPWQEGRFNFTLAHEIGHWVLHHDEYLAQEQQGALFKTCQPSDLVSRRSERSSRIEYQANRFASCLLLPRALVHRAWLDKVGPSAAMSPDASKRAIRTVAKLFCTSIEATGYRLEELGLTSSQPHPRFGV